ncbi:hypothetical protein CMV_014950 [Castanea mollissima]|uniref:Uncharacterized protein n=1 Tax=Castanea mollissima TaxID=60419 RepID=A0A8J4RAW7_9ROSI|nr:hypothetical protein CMV_014950 [Castanea mollissima]
MVGNQLKKTFKQVFAFKNMRYVDLSRLPQSARSAQTSEIFVQIREMIRLPPNLPPCHMLIVPPPNSSSTISPAFLPSPNYLHTEYCFVLDGYGDEIPNWFNHQSNENSISFLIGPEFPTIALCVAIEVTPTEIVKARSRHFQYHVCISINGSKRLLQARVYSSEDFNKLVFCCRPQSSLQELFEDLNLGDRNLVQIFCETSHHAGKIVPVITRVGVHVECICSPQKSQGCQISKSIVQRNRRRPALLHGSSFIMRKQYNTKQPTRIKENETLLIKFQQKHWKVGTLSRTVDDEQGSSIEYEVLRGNSQCQGLVAEAWNEMVKTVQWDIGLIMAKMTLRHRHNIWEANIMT